MTKRSTSVSPASFSEDDLILHVIVIISILIEVLISCFIPQPKQSLNALATSPSQTKKPRSSSKQTSTTSQEKPSASSAQATRKSTSKARSGSTGSQSTPRKNSKAGTKSQATRTSRSGPSIASASHQETTRSNQTIPTPGSAFSDLSDVNSTREQATCSDHQSEKPVHLLPVTQEEERKHTVLRSKVSVPELKT